MKRFIIISLVYISLLNICFADTKISIGNLSYKLRKNTVPTDVFPSAKAYPNDKYSNDFTFNVRFPGYKYYAAVNGSGFYPGWDAGRNQTTGVITVTSPRGYVYTFDNGSAQLNEEATPLKLTQIKDPNGDYEGIFTYDSNDLLTQIKENNDTDSVYIQFNYDANDTLTSLTTIDPSVSSSSDNYSRVYDIIYDGNGRVVSASCSSGCGCGGSSSQGWLTDVYDVNGLLVSQKDNTDQTIYTYGYFDDGSFKYKKDKDGNYITKIEKEDMIDDATKQKIFNYIDPNIYRYTEQVFDGNNSMTSETIYRDLRDDRADPNTYDPNCFTTRYIYEDNVNITTEIPDGADPNGLGVRTVTVYDEDYKFNYQREYDSNNEYRKVSDENYVSGFLEDSYDVRQAHHEYEYITGTSLVYKHILPDDYSNKSHYYRYIYDDYNRKTTEEIKLDEGGVSDQSDPLIQSKHFEYDKYGNICKEYLNAISDRSEPNSMVTEYVYNAFGNLLWQISPDGVVTGKTYDASGKVESDFTLAGGYAGFSQISNPLDCNLATLEVVTQKKYYYHSVCEKVEYVYTAIDSNEFYYDSPDGWSITKYSYDSYGRKNAEIKDFGGDYITTQYQYNMQDDVNCITFPDGHTETTYTDGRGLTIAAVKTGSTESISTYYTYDNRGNLIEVKVDDTVVNSYQYDDFGRKTKTYYGDVNSANFTEYIYDQIYYTNSWRDTDDIESEVIWDVDPNIDPIEIKDTFRVYDIFGRVIFQQILSDPNNGESSYYDNITYFRYDILGNMTMKASLGEDSSYFGGYAYDPYVYSNTGDILELRKYNDNLQLAGIMKFEYPAITSFDVNITDIESYILVNDPNVFYTKYEYLNSQLLNQYTYTGVDSNSNELTFVRTQSYDYDTAGRTIRTIDADDNYTAIAYNSLNLPTENTLYQGKQILRFNDSNSLDPNFVPYPLKRSLTAYDSLGRKIRTAVLKDPNENIGINDINMTGDFITDYVYDANGMLYRQKQYYDGDMVTNFVSAYTQYNYDSLGRVEQIIQGRLEEVDVFGSIWETPDGLKYTTYQYNNLGQKSVETITDVNTIDRSIVDVNTYYYYDNQGRVTEIYNEGGRLAKNYYDTLGRKTAAIDAHGMLTLNYYDSLDNLYATIEDANNLQRTTNYGYDRNNRRTSVSSNSDTTTYTYNYLGKIDSITYPDDKEIAYGYDMLGNVTNRTITENSNSVTTQYKRNILGRIAFKQYSNDPNWNDPNTALPFDEILYDAAGNKSIMASIESGSDLELALYYHDGLGNLTNSAESYSDISYNVMYGYDQRGLLKAIYYPEEKLVEYTRDALGRITSVSYNGDRIVQYYWLGDKVIGKEFNNNISYTANIDALGRVDDERYGNLTFDYAYSNHTSRLTDRNTSDYSYDTLGRVDQEDSTTYTFDILGNPTNATEDNLIYTLDNENRVTDVNDGTGIFVTYKYDRLGRRTSKTVDSNTVCFAYDKSGNIISEYAKDGNDVDWLRDYVYGASGELVYMALHETDGYWAGTGFDDLFDFCYAWLCSPLCDANDLLWDYDNDNDITFADWAYHANDIDVYYVPASQNSKYILTDMMGSVIGVADANGSAVEITYNAWGTPYYSGSLDGLNILWNGYYSDAEAGNYYLRNRYYSPLERKFITEDPRGIVPDGIWNNQFSILNQYNDGFGLSVYCQSDPLNYKDPNGLAVNPVVGIAIGAAAACITPQVAYMHYGYPSDYWTNDKWAHCVVSCRISKTCGKLIAVAGGWGKELRDEVEKRIGLSDIGWDWDDDIANSAGRRCAGWWSNIPIGRVANLFTESCDCCCQKKGYGRH